MSEAESWNTVRSILCVRLDNMGDVLMTTPALRALKQAAPQRRLTLWASPSGAAVAPYLPDVDHVIAHDVAWVKNAAQGNVQDWQALQAVHDGCFDAAIIFTVFSQSALPAALVCHMAGIPRVLAYSRENPYRLISDWVPEPEPDRAHRHEVQRQLDLVATTGAVCTERGLSFVTQASDRMRVQECLSALGIVASAAWIVVHCGASAPSRRYPSALFAQALKGLAALDRPLLLTGSDSERGLVSQVIDAAGLTGRAVNLAGLLTLGELGCLIEDAAVLVTNNTGPAHIAAAVNTPIVELYALTNPQHTPWQVTHRLLFCDVPCRYCYRSICPQGTNACLSGVAPEAVIEAVEELLGLEAFATEESVVVSQLPAALPDFE